MDLIEQLPDSDGSTAILVVVDRLTKMSLFIPTTNSVTADGIARMFVEHVFSKHGVPSDVVSDRGTEFTSHFWRSLGTLLDMKLNFSTAFHPQTNGQTERTNQTLKQYLRLYCNYRQNNSYLYQGTFKFIDSGRIPDGSHGGFSPFDVDRLTSPNNRDNRGVERQALGVSYRH